jgi:hypothetical protein
VPRLRAREQVREREAQPVDDVGGGLQQHHCQRRQQEGAVQGHVGESSHRAKGLARARVLAGAKDLARAKVWAKGEGLGQERRSRPRA